MIIKDYLSNGIHIILEPVENRRSVSAGIWINAGSADEDNKNNGIAHAVEHMLFQGTKSSTARDIARSSASIGGDVNAFTEKECTAFYVRTLPEHLEKGIGLLSDMLCHPLLSPESFEKEKGVLCEEIDMYEDSPEDMVYDTLQNYVWKDHPLGYIITGTKENVKKFNQSDLLSFMRQYYTCQNTVISIAGNFDVCSVRILLEECFADYPDGTKNVNRTRPRYFRINEKEEKDIEQCHVCIAYPAFTMFSPERYSFGVMNSIMGGSVNSRLFQHIREELGIAYALESYGSLYNKSGLIHIYAAMNPSQLTNATEEILSVIEKFKKGITADELQEAKDEMKTEYILNRESMQYRMESNARAALNGLEILEEYKRLSLIDSLKQTDILELAGKYLIQDEMSIYTIGK